MPFTWLLLLLLFFIFTKNQQYKKISIRFFIVLFLFFHNESLLNWAFLRWEIPPTPYSEVKKDTYQTAIVLTGITWGGKKLKDRIYFGRAVDRLLFAHRLYKEGKVKKILISGAEFDANLKINKNQENLKKILISFGVPKQDIFIEDQSKNTHENALNTRTIFRQNNYLKDKHLLLTSGFHMRRSLACFKKQGIQVSPFSADFYGTDIFSIGERIFVFTDNGLYQWSILSKEWVGMMVYYLMGYV